MFKALNLKTQKAIIILAPFWRTRLDILRSLDRADNLVCPVCEQPVRVKAGKTVRWHFAHKHLHNCPLQHISSELLAARAALYPWLVTQFGEARVSMESMPDGITLRRPLDFLVQGADGGIAYWIIDVRLKPKLREELLKEFEKSGLHINWLFSVDMLQVDVSDMECVYLTTTERDFRQASAYDLIGARDISHPGTTVNYLDAEKGLLHTYRSLRLVHPPQLFRGFPLISELSEVRADHRTGILFHPGEAEALEEARLVQSARQALHAQAREVFRQHLAAPGKRPQRVTAVQGTDGDATANDDNPFASKKKPKPAPPPAHQFGKVEAACMYCGQLTSDWWYLDRKTGRCKCRECLRQGIA